MLRTRELRPFARCSHLVRAREAALSRPSPPAPEGQRPCGVGWLPLYAADARQPFAPAASSGPWIVTTAGGTVYDAGGYGMLAFGHNPPAVARALAAPQHQANIMTPNAAQDAFARALWPHVGRRVVVACLNSGSEANSLALRVANTHREPRPVVVALKGSFHGRTEGPAAVSHSTLAAYRAHLARYAADADGAADVRWLEPNDVAGAHALFDELRASGRFPECAILEGVLGEGRPATPLTPAFYAAVHERTRDAGGLVLVDSVQAGLRCYGGALSIVDAPGFEHAPRPDMETFAKAVHGGQFPVSILALGDRAAARYAAGTYGNTMAATPRALDVVRACLGEMTPDVRRNVRERGAQLRRLLEEACADQFVDEVRGAGLLLAIKLRDPRAAPRAERALREQGLNVIRGGEGCLRLTPWFHMSAAEARLVQGVVRRVLGRRGLLGRPTP